MKKRMIFCLIVLLCGGLMSGGVWAQDEKATPDTSAEEPAIEACVRDYIEGWFASDSERLARALHPNLFKVRVQTMRGTEDEILDTMDAETLGAYAKHNQTWVKDKQGAKELSILYNDGKIAVVHAVSDGFYDICGLVKMNGQWKILQVLWDEN